MLKLLLLSVAPIFIILFYVYIRDRYEKEPIHFLAAGVFYGVMISLPVVFCEMFVESLLPQLKDDVFFLSFASASLTEESFKFLIIILLCFNSKYYNTFFDGIVYSVFISLGFAGIENVLYVFDSELGGVQTAVMRAFLSVPAHALFAVSMGYYLSYAKYYRRIYFLPAFLSPFLKHGLYDLILMSDFDKYYVIFACFIVFLWTDASKKFNRASNF
ncbi:MAG: PrsW family intramembrane metalloprotease [Firmicutes bacterium]|nr:PrsW family intramembrane metalloprotease [Bacillota bacterium]